MVSDFVVTPDGGALQLTRTPTATLILMSGCLGLTAVRRLGEALTSLHGDVPVPVLLRITATELEFGAARALRGLLTMRHLRGPHRLAVWAEEPLVRRAIPFALLHETPPHGGPGWDLAVPSSP